MMEFDYKFRLQPIISLGGSIVYHEVLTSVYRNGTKLCSNSHFSSLKPLEQLIHLNELFSFLSQFSFISVTINLSWSQINEPMTVQMVNYHARELHNSNNVSFCIEVTESNAGIIRNSSDIISCYEGVSFWLDDFGSQISNYDVLHDFGFDVIKLDKTIFWHLFKYDHKHLKSLIKYLNSNSNLGVVIEGIENREQLVFSMENGCFCQGFYVDKVVGLNFDEKIA